MRLDTSQNFLRRQRTQGTCWRGSSHCLPRLLASSGRLHSIEEDSLEYCFEVLAWIPMPNIGRSKGIKPEEIEPSAQFELAHAQDMAGLSVSRVWEKVLAYYEEKGLTIP